MTRLKVRLKVLFADDHLQQHLSDQYIRDRIEESYPGLDRDELGRLMKEHREYLQVLPRAVEALRDDGYEVIPVDSYHKAMREATNTRFDIAIVDMGWFLDKELPPEERGSAGWKICEAIKGADITSKRTPLTAQIAYSGRFAKTPSMSTQAADSGILPLFKNQEVATYLSRWPKVL